jgi:hypothetical protein
LKFGLKISKINDVYLTSDEDWKYETYIAPSKKYILNNGDTILIAKLLGYSIGKESVRVYIITSKEQYLTFTYFNINSVHSNSPIVSSSLKKRNINFIDLKDKHYFIKYWGLYYYGLICIWLLILTWSIFGIFCAPFKKKK